MTHTQKGGQPVREPQQWFDLYSESWQGVVVDEAFSHPAKFARGLIRTIYDYMFYQGWLKPGEKVLDPFGGIGLGAYHAMRKGLHWVGHELEPFFVDIGAGCDCPGFTADQWRRWYGRAGRWSGLCPRCQWVLNKPPDQDSAPLSPRRQARQARMKELAKKHQRSACFGKALPLPDTLTYWQTAGKPRMMTLFDLPEGAVVGKAEQNSGRIPIVSPHRYEGNIEKWGKLGLPGTAVLLQGDSRYLLDTLGQPQGDAAVSSSPYASDTVHGRNGIDLDKTQRPGKNSQAATMDVYGASAGNLGHMKEGTLDGVVSSPPFMESGVDDSRPYGGIAEVKKQGGVVCKTYGTTPGQLGAMPPGNLDGVVSSPPFGEAETRNRTPHSGGHVGDFMTRAYTQDKQGTTQGNLATLPTEGFDTAVSSSPFANQLPSHDNFTAPKDTGRRMAVDYDTAYGQSGGQLGGLPEGSFDTAVSSPPYAEAVGKGEGPGARHDYDTHSPDNARTPANEASYGETAGNIGNNSGETFWSAARQIVEQTYLALKPGAVSAWVCGNYVRSGKIIPFDEMWLELCVACGFEPLEMVIAWKKKPGPAQIDIHGNDHDQTKRHLSFFRIQSNTKNPAAAIESETVVFVRKPL